MGNTVVDKFDFFRLYTKKKDHEEKFCFQSRIMFMKPLLNVFSSGHECILSVHSRSVKMASYSLAAERPCRRAIEPNDYHKLNTVMDPPSCLTFGNRQCGLKD